jgi:hypothetical protein
MWLAITGNSWKNACLFCENWASLSPHQVRIHMKYALLAALLCATGSAQAATFVAEAKGDTVVVYSTSKAKEECQIKNTFSYLFKAERYTTTQTCNISVLPGNHVEVCRVQDEVIVEPKIEKPVAVVSCTPKP